MEQLDFDSILRETHVRIRAYIAGMGIVAHEVDDVAQDVYLEFYKSFSKMPEDVAAERWLKGIARNVCLNHIRNRSRRGKKQREALAELLLQAEAHMRQYPHDEMTSALGDCCDRLAPKSQQMVKLRYVGDLSSQEIADKMNSTAEAIRIALHRVRITLRNCIQESLAKP